ncbi:MAG TPA: preprotein translocase subunit SecE [Candidatus Limnocylindria bacterium]|jgi:preprotein translocase SecE subunit|nr:preprotein translocase subunit SecE [Candidatus Limnocylindria bacterium]
MSKFNINLLIWVVVIGVVFAIVWKQGYLTRISTYVQETRDELKKCAWPNQAELWQSTLLILTTVALMGLFTVCVDFVILRFVTLLHPH